MTTTPFEIIRLFLSNQISLDSVINYIKENPKSKNLFSFYNLSKLFINSPRITYLIHKYLNNLYTDTRYTLETELTILDELISQYKDKLNPYTIAKTGKEINEANKKLNENLLLLKSLELFFKLFTPYKDIDEEDIIFLKLLYEYRLLPQEQINKLNQIIEELKEIVINQEKLDSTINNSKRKKKRKNQLLRLLKENNIKPEDIINELKNIEETLKQDNNMLDSKLEEDNSNSYCNFCPLNKLNLPKVHYEIVSNGNNNGDIPVMILGLNPGAEEIKLNRPFIGKSGQLLRKHLQQYFDTNNIPYIITNIIHCHTNNQNELENILKQENINNISDIPCNYFIDYILQYNVRYVLCFGDKAYKYAYEKLKNTKLLDKVTLISLKHPSYYLRRGKHNELINEYVETFQIIVNQLTDKPVNNNNKNQQVNIKRKNINVKQIKSIDEIPENLTLIDIKVLEKKNEYLILTLDEHGNKHYFTMPFSTIIYYNPNNDNPRECRYLENKDYLTPIIIDNYFEYRKLVTDLRKQYRKFFELKDTT